MSTSLKPRSKTRLTVVLAAKASTASTEWGYGILWQSDAITSPQWLRMIAPSLASFDFAKIAPSKFTLYLLKLSGFRLV